MVQSTQIMENLRDGSISNRPKRFVREAGQVVLQKPEFLKILTCPENHACSYKEY